MADGDGITLPSRRDDKDTHKDYIYFIFLLNTMIITQIKTGQRGTTYSPISMDELVTAIRECNYINALKDFRELLLMEGLDSHGKMPTVTSNQIPSLCFAALWRKNNAQLVMREYNRLVLLEITNLPSTEEACRVRNRAAVIPYTRLAFVGATGRDVVIVCAMTSEGIDNCELEHLKTVHLTAYKMLHYLYSSQLLLSVDNKEPRLDCACLMSADAGVYYNANSEPYVVTDEAVEVPLYKGGRTGAEPHFHEGNVLTMYSIYESCLEKALEDARMCMGEGMTEHDFYMCALSKLAAYCNDTNIPMDFGIRHALWKKDFGEDRMFIEKVFANAYESRTSKLIPYGGIDKDALIVYKTEAFLKMHYELRRNVMTGVVQYRKRDGFDYDFHDLTEGALNTMTNRALKAGIRSWDKDVRRIINSDDVRRFDPIGDYIFSLPEWDGKDRVAELVSRIPTDCPNVQLYIHTWLLSMVAHWLGRDRHHGNALVPLLIGHQGCGKTTLCSMLLPPALATYYNDKVNFKNDTDLNLGLSSFALINIDEFDSVKKSQQAVLKYLLSKNTVTMRPPYGKAYVNRRRYASFIATTNKERPLVDRTGSRRFACIQILAGKSIDTTTPIDHDQLYAQLYHEIYNGARYWLNDEETRALMSHNEKYREMADLSELVDAVFELPQNEGEGEYLTTYELIDCLVKASPALPRSKTLNSELGKVMRGKHFEYQHRHAGAVYRVKQKH